MFNWRAYVQNIQSTRWIPLLISLGVLLCLFFLIFFIKKSFLLMPVLCILAICFLLLRWFWEMYVEYSMRWRYSRKIIAALCCGFFLFLVSEVMLFGGFFWTYFYSFFNPWFSQIRIDISYLANLDFVAIFNSIIIWIALFPVMFIYIYENFRLNAKSILLLCLGVGVFILANTYNVRWADVMYALQYTIQTESFRCLLLGWVQCAIVQICTHWQFFYNYYACKASLSIYALGCNLRSIKHARTISTRHKQIEIVRNAYSLPRLMCFFFMLFGFILVVLCNVGNDAEAGTTTTNIGYVDAKQVDVAATNKEVPLVPDGYTGWDFYIRKFRRWRLEHYVANSYAHNNNLQHFANSHAHPNHVHISHKFVLEHVINTVGGYKWSGERERALLKVFAKCYSYNTWYYAQENNFDTFSKNFLLNDQNKKVRVIMRILHELTTDAYRFEYQFKGKQGDKIWWFKPRSWDQFEPLLKNNAILGGITAPAPAAAPVRILFEPLIEENAKLDRIPSDPASMLASELCAAISIFEPIPVFYEEFEKNAK